MAKVRIYQKPAGIPVNTSVFAVEILQNNIWYTRKVSWETLKGLIAGAESLVFANGTLTFTTPDGVAHQVLSVDSEVTPNSANPVSSGAVSTALASKQDTLTFDQVPTDGSTNPVESNGIYDALALKQDVLTFDTTPTDGSTNPVTSAGIYAAISAITTGIDWKEAVATYADIATTYPNPQDGWTVTTLDDDHTYRYTGTEWVDMFSLITQATAEKDGLMSAADFTKLAGIEAQANKTVVSDTLTPSTTTKKLATVSGGGSSTDILGDDADAILRAAFGEHTATGNPVTFDAFLGLEVPSECKVTMNPIQDLHGYSNPWVGGAGKNKLPFPYAFSSQTVNGVTFTIQDDGGVKVNGTATASTNVRLLDTTDEYEGIQFRVGIGSSNVTVRAYSGSTGVANSNGNMSSIFTASSTFNLRLVVSNGTTVNNEVIYPRIYLSTETDYTYAPYENICPISGRDSVTVTRTGKNVCPNDLTGGTSSGVAFTKNSDGTVLVNGKGTSTANKLVTDYCPLKAGTTYVLSGCPSGGASGKFGLVMYVNDVAVANDYGDGATYTPTEDTFAKIRIRFWYNFQITDKVFSPMVRISGTSEDYEPYQGETHTHTYASTVYGGVDDFVSGEGSVTYVTVDLGTFDWTYSDASGIFYTSSPTNMGERKYGGVTALSEIYKVWTGESADFLTSDAVISVNNRYISNQNRISIRDSRYTSAADFKTAMSGVQLCYELATPTQITNTPEDITLLKGVNVVSTDGDSIELKYSADIKAYIDSKLNA